MTSVQKKVVVIDVGYRYTKLGVGGDPHPRCIIPTVYRDPLSSSLKNVFDYKEKQDLYNNFVEFLHYLYFKKLLISPKDTKVVVVESLLGPTIVRETLAKVLFCHLQISSLLMVPSHVVSLYSLAVTTALVIDIGHQEACVIPVYEGYAVLHAYEAQPLAGQAIEVNLRKLLMEHYANADSSKAIVVENLPQKTVEDIKVRLCFVTPLDRSRRIREGKDVPAPPPSVEYNLAGTDSLAIDGRIRETACEVLFELDGDEISLTTMILNSLLKCPIDMRKPLSENILVMGGTASAPGIKSRILSELRHHVTTPKYKDKLFVNNFKMHAPPSKENYTAWLGGSLVGATEMVNFSSVSSEYYMREKDIPDWANLKYNRREEGTNRK